MKARHYLLAAALIVTAWFSFIADKAPGGGVAEPVERTGHTNAQKKPQPQSKSAALAPPVAGPAAVATVDASKSNAEKGNGKPEPLILALRNRAELIGGATVAGNTNGLFGSQSWTPPPAPEPKPSAAPPPTAPALPFTFLGKKLEDGSWEVYLGRGDNTLIVQEKTEIDATYRVESIKPPTLTLTYLPLNQMQTMPIGGVE